MLFGPRGRQFDRVLSYAQGTDKAVIRRRVAEADCSACWHRRLVLWKMPASHAFVCGDAWAINLDERCHEDEGPRCTTEAVQQTVNIGAMHALADRKKGKWVY
jgi:hypothetical protein